MSDIRVGIISANWGVAAHLPAWRAVPGVEVVGICTAHRETAEAAAAANGIALPFWDATEMARHPDIDVVDVGTRPDLRRDMCLAALAAGKHVYDGIPFAASLGDAKALRDAQARSGCVGVVDAYSEYLAPLRFAKELVDEGTLGRLQSVAARLELSLFDRPTSTFPYNWFAHRRHGASAVRNLGSHLVHLLVYLFGPVEDVAGVPLRFVDEWRFVDNGGVLASEVEDTGAAVLRLACGALATVSVSWAAAASPGFVLDAAGHTGRVVLRADMMPSEQATVSVGRAGGPLAEVAVPERLRTGGPVDIEPEYPGDPRRAMALSFANMVGAIRGEAQARPDFGCAYHVQSVIEAVHRSADERSWVRPAEL
ncbi:MAG TPA: Gfo/Idh/MocA family oxidoreductase [Acidimicrobiales bacterium]|nr:Gfo/Idh/MocA family oxidoreductase [Acidimicrobiales bacterium]